MTRLSFHGIIEHAFDIIEVKNVMPYEPLNDRDYEIVHRYFTLRVGRKLLQDDMRKFRTNEAGVHMADLYHDLIEQSLTHIESKLTALEGQYIRVHKTDDPLAYDVKVGNHRGLFFRIAWRFNSLFRN